jgi:hypothetical protein
MPALSSWRSEHLLVGLFGLVSGQLVAWDWMASDPVGVFDPRGRVDALAG